jgi:DNA-binding MarR family transcriptional regulator
MEILNEVIHQPVRLRLMALLTTLQPETQVGFTYLKEMFNLTDGNLGVHLRKLEEAGYICISKTYVSSRPHTYIAATELGRRAFAEYTAALKAILENRQYEYESDVREYRVKKEG